jgi:hypothetical protein
MNSPINRLMDEAETWLKEVSDETIGIDLKNRVFKTYSEDDLLDVLKGIKSYPAVGIAYDGMISESEPGLTHKVGVSNTVIISFILVQSGDANFRTDQKRAKAIDVLDLMRDRFLGQRSAATSHYWLFLSETAAELKSGMVCWVQRWRIPVQLAPTRPPRIS